MNKLKTLLLTFTSIILLSTSPAYAVAEPSVEGKNKEEKNAPDLKDSVEYQKVIDEYKSYVATIPVEIREEVIAYRTEVAKLNKQKRTLYRKLSQASQDYLKKEQQYKKRLPLQRKSLINLEGSSEAAGTDNGQDTQATPAE